MGDSSKDTAAGEGPVGAAAGIKALVHKSVAEHVWITSAVETAAAGVSARFRFATFGAHVRLADLIEVQRQAGMIHAHRALGVPPSHVFVLNSIALAATGDWDGAEPTIEGTVRVSADGAASVAAPPRAAGQRFTLESDAGATAVGSSRASFVPRPVYERLRKRHAEPLATATAREDAATESFELRPPQGDPLLGDHAVDHVSAMTLISSIEHALIERHPGRRLARLSLDFASYAELGDPPSVLRIAVSREGFRGVVAQDDAVKVVVEGALTHP